MFVALLKKFRKQPVKKTANMPTSDRIGRNQEIVFEAVVKLNRPVNARQVASFLSWDSASVTNRLSELTKKERIVVHNRKRGLDGIWRKYYVVARHGA